MENTSGLLTNKQEQVRNGQAKQRRKILERLITVIKLIGKRRLSYRGVANEASKTLNDDTIDHGYCLELMMLLSKLDELTSNRIMQIVKQDQWTV